ncbi:MAG: hypothetical protein Q9181_005566 [Wetmoreana brouardii]
MDHRILSRIEDRHAYTSDTGNHTGNERQDRKTLLPFWVLDCVHAAIVPDMVGGEDGTGVCDGGEGAADDEERFEVAGTDVGDEALGINASIYFGVPGCRDGILTIHMDSAVLGKRADLRQPSI